MTAQGVITNCRSHSVHGQDVLIGGLDLWVPGRDIVDLQWVTLGDDQLCRLQQQLISLGTSRSVKRHLKVTACHPLHNGRHNVRPIACCSLAQFCCICSCQVCGMLAYTTLKLVCVASFMLTECCQVHSGHYKTDKATCSAASTSPVYMLACYIPSIVADNVGTLVVPAGAVVHSSTS